MQLRAAPRHLVGSLVVGNGATPSDQIFVLDAAGWVSLPTGYAYRGPADVDADPVKKVILNATGRAVHRHGPRFRWQKVRELW